MIISSTSPFKAQERTDVLIPPDFFYIESLREIVPDREFRTNEDAEIKTSREDFDHELSNKIAVICSSVRAGHHGAFAAGFGNIFCITRMTVFQGSGPRPEEQF